MAARNPGTGRRKSAKRTMSTPRPSRKKTGVIRRRRVGKTTQGGTQVYRETYRAKRGRGKPRRTVARNVTSKSSVRRRQRYQTGKQTKKGRKQDGHTLARYPGIRTSRSGNTYTERRRNRSDARTRTRR